MVTFDAGETLAERFRSHMGHSSSLYGYAMRGMADDWEAGGPTREACRGWEDSPNGTMVQLRFLAGVFRLVLAGAAPELVPYYPCLGGTLPPDGVWPVMREVVGRHTEQVHEALAIVPQTNEPGRSTALLVGLFDAVEAWGLDRIRLIEVGASGGLNLHVDRFRYDGPGWSWGPPDSPLVLHTQAPGVTPPSVRDRRAPGVRRGPGRRCLARGSATPAVLRLAVATRAPRATHRRARGGGGIPGGGRTGRGGGVPAARARRSTC